MIQWLKGLTIALPICPCIRCISGRVFLRDQKRPLDGRQIKRGHRSRMRPEKHQSFNFDAIVILGAAVWAGGKPSPALERRIQHAAKLYHQGAAPIIIGSGGLGKHPPSEAEIMAKCLVELGVPASSILSETRSHTTLENATYSARILRRSGGQRVLVVSDRYHLPRAVLCFRTLGFSAHGSGPSLTQTNTPYRKWLYACLRELAAYPFYIWKLRFLRHRA